MTSYTIINSISFLKLIVFNILYLVYLFNDRYYYTIPPFYFKMKKSLLIQSNKFRSRHRKYVLFR